MNFKHNLRKHPSDLVIENESSVGDSWQFEHDVSLLQQEVADLHGANSGFTAKNRCRSKK
jgi:hypothetical protein